MDTFSADSDEKAKCTEFEQKTETRQNPHQAVGFAPGKTPGAPDRPAQGPQAPPGMGPLRPSDVDFMPGLLRSLSVLLRLRGRTVSPQVLMAGLTGSKVSPQSCLRAARKAGLSKRGTRIAP